MFKAEVLEMPFVATLRRREKSKIEKVWDTVKQISDIEREVGRLLPQAFAAKLLNLSRQRICQLVDEGILQSFTVGNVRMVTEASIITLAQTERKAGRPPNLPTTFREAHRRAKELVK